MMPRIRPFKQLVLTTAMLAQLCGCSGAAILDLAIPDTGYILHKDIAYGSLPRQKLDVYVPEQPAPYAGVILFFYGGSWQKGSKELYRFVAQTFASRGYITVIADYRLYPDVYYPAFVEDGAEALAWVHRHIGEYGGDNDRIFLAGHSAGAYIAAMLALDSRFTREAGGSPAWIKGVMALSGPYDFLPFTDPDIQSIFSQADDASTQPINFAHNNAPPFLLLSGDEDKDVGVSNTRHLARKLDELGSPITMRIYHGVGHIGIILALAEGFHSKASTLQDMLSFLENHGDQVKGSQEAAGVRAGG